MTSDRDPTNATPRFDVVTDGGCDFPAGLLSAPFAPFSLHFGNTSYLATDLSREQFFEQLRTNPAHPTTSQPTPQQFIELFERAERSVLCLTISSGLSGSMGAADQAQRNVSRDVHLLDSRTVSAAEAFQVHAVQTARERGHEIATALDWARQVADETELYFTIDTLEYLRRGGRIGRVQATLGGLLNLKPVVTVDKTTGTYTNVARARSWKGAIDAMADRVTAKFGAGTPLRLGLLYGDDSAYADAVLERLRERHPIVWHGVAPVGPALAVHTGPKAVGVAAAPGPWPWDR